MTTQSIENQEYLSFAIKLARHAGQNAMKRRGRNAQLVPNTQDHLVTKADTTNRDYIVPRIRRRFPSHGIFTEESGRQEGSSSLEWFIDEVDGTSNLRQGDPNFSTSIALRRDGVGILGVVYAPALKRLYYAVENQGAWVIEQKWYGRRTKRIHVSGDNSTSRWNMSFGEGIDSKEPIEDGARIVLDIIGSDLFKKFRRRMTESTALDLCHVAEGWHGAHYNNKAKPWDIAAGEVIVREAGGQVTYLGDEEILVSNGVIHTELIQIIQKASQL